MGMPDPQQRQQEPYQYQFPIQMQRVPERDGKKELVDWAVTTFGASPFLVAAAIGFYVLARKAIKGLGLERISDRTKKP